MAFTEAMLKHAIREAVGTLQITRGEHVIDFDKPWPRVRLRDVILEKSGIDIDLHHDAGSLRTAIFAAKVDLDNPDAGRGSLIDQLYKREDFPPPTVVSTKSPKPGVSRSVLRASRVRGSSLVSPKSAWTIR